MTTVPCYRCGKPIPDGEPRAVLNNDLHLVVEIAARPDDAPLHTTSCWDCAPNRVLWAEARRDIDQ